MLLEYNEGCEKIEKLKNRLDEILINYKQSNRVEIKAIGERIEKFRKAFDSTRHLYEIREYIDPSLYSLLKDEYETFMDIIKDYQNEHYLKEAIENGETIYVTTNDPYDPANIQPSDEDRRKHTTVGDIKKMLEEFPDDMIALGQCEGGIYGLPSFTTLSLDDECLEAECIELPEDYEHKDMKGDSEFLFFE
jgi:hypothetical protein